MKMRSPRPISKLIGPANFSVEWEVGGRGATSDPRGSKVAPTNDCDRSVRPLIKYGRGDPPSRLNLQWKRRLLYWKKEVAPTDFEIDRSDQFSC